jgi:hypothetical protein
MTPDTCAPSHESCSRKRWTAICPSIREIADRLDGRPAQAIERGDIPVEVLSDPELFAIIRGGSLEPVDEPGYPMIAGPKQQ